VSDRISNFITKNIFQCGKTGLMITVKLLCMECLANLPLPKYSTRPMVQVDHLYWDMVVIL